MITISCPCKYPILMVDTRNGEDEGYIAIPDDEFSILGHVNNPELEEVEEEGFDGKRHKYMKVTWADASSATTKKYDVADHIILAGCNSLTTDGKKAVCKNKELYEVYHPLSEWKKQHIVKIK